MIVIEKKKEISGQLKKNSNYIRKDIKKKQWKLDGGWKTLIPHTHPT